MYRASHDYSATRALLHIALPSMQISWRFVSTAIVALLRLLGGVVVRGALGASRAVAQAAATVAPQPPLLVLPAADAPVVAQFAPQLAGALLTSDHCPGIIAESAVQPCATPARLSPEKSRRTMRGRACIALQLRALRIKRNVSR